MSDVPRFPDSRPLAAEDKAMLDQRSRIYDPYAEATFMTLAVWNPPEGATISQLHGNLVLLHKSCDTGGDIMTFLGSARPVDTASTLLEYGEGNVSLVPNYCLVTVAPYEWEKAGLTVLADRDNDDYVYDLYRLARLEGPELSRKRKRARAFERRCSPVLVSLDLGSSRDLDAVGRCIQEWCRQKQARGSEPPPQEISGIQRLLEKLGGCSRELHGFGARAAGELVAVSLVESHGGAMVSGVAFKALQDAKGAAEFLRSASASLLASRGFRYINVQQDLGLPGLRSVKSSYRPDRMLRKWRITRLQRG